MNMTHAEADNFAKTCKDAQKAVQLYRQEIQPLKELIENGYGYQAKENKMY